VAVACLTSLHAAVCLFLCSPVAWLSGTVMLLTWQQAGASCWHMPCEPSCLLYALCATRWHTHMCCRAAGQLHQAFIHPSPLITAAAVAAALSCTAAAAGSGRTLHSTWRLVWLALLHPSCWPAAAAQQCSTSHCWMGGGSWQEQQQSEVCMDTQCVTHSIKQSCIKYVLCVVLRVVGWAWSCRFHWNSSCQARGKAAS
jgi:hypothetical protein